jgi:hypothetical protein
VGADLAAAVLLAGPNGTSTGGVYRMMDNEKRKKLGPFAGPTYVEREVALCKCIRIYLWARDHLQEMQAEYPTFTLQWAELDIQRAFNIAPEEYLRLAICLGGGTDPAKFERGCKLIMQFSRYETSRAVSLLGPDRIKSLLDTLPATAGADTFHNAVDALHAKEIASLRIARRPLLRSPPKPPPYDDDDD